MLEKIRVWFPSYRDCMHSRNYGDVCIFSRGVAGVGAKAYMEVHEKGVDYDVTGPRYDEFHHVDFLKLRGEDLRAVLSGNQDWINDVRSNGFRKSKRLSQEEFEAAIESESKSLQFPSLDDFRKRAREKSDEHEKSGERSAILSEDELYDTEYETIDGEVLTVDL